MQRGSRGTILVAVVVAAVLVAGLAWWWSRPDDRTQVVVVGDSVSYLSAGRIESRLGDDHDLRFLTKPGYTTSQELVVLQGAIDEGDPVVAARDVIVVLVGYNDLLLDTPDTEALDDLVEASSRWRCAVWMELPERPGGQPSVNPKVSPEAVAAWNDRLATAIEPHEDVHLVGDWRDVVARNSAADLLSDGVHPTEAGQRRLADAYRAAIERHC